MRTSRAYALLAVVVLSGVASGCASPSVAGSPGGAGSDVSSPYVCGGAAIDSAAYREARSPDELSPAAAALVAGASDDLGDPVTVDDLASWSIVSESSARVTLIRPLAEPADLHGNGELHDHELFTATTELGDIPSYGQLSSCALSLDPARLTGALVQRDLAALPSPDDTTIALLVTEGACNSGRDAAGRIELISLEETDASVTVRIGIRPEGGPQTCPSNPTTPFTIELAERLGDRVLLDGSLVSPRPLTDGHAISFD